MISNPVPDHWPSTVSGPLHDQWPYTWTLNLYCLWPSTWSVTLYLNTEPLLSLALYMISIPVPDHWPSTASGPLHDEKPSLYLITGSCDELLPGFVGGLPLLERGDEGGAVGQAGGNSEGRVQAPEDNPPCSSTVIKYLRYTINNIYNLQQEIIATLMW